MKRIGKIAGLLLSAALIGCIGMSCSEKAEQVAATETADQMEDAKRATAEGRDAAKAIITKNWTDTMQLQQAILEARAANSKYDIDGKKELKAVFDSAFFSTIRTVRPDLADQLKQR